MTTAPPARAPAAASGRRRAVQAHHKRERRDAILEAAARLLEAQGTFSASIADIAEEAGLAKGTVYLYFASKEALYFALYERELDEFLHELVATIESDQGFGIDTVLALIHRCLVAPTRFLLLAARCIGGLSGEMRASTIRRPDAGDVHGLLGRAGTGLEQRCARLAHGEGSALLRRTYALVVGLWQMSAGQGGRSASERRARYGRDVDDAVRALWRGTVE